MKRKKFLTSGEFAALCKTSKATLFHYDQLGLLKPRHVAANGYRRYGAEQFFDFDMISLLKETGSSLEEIKWHRRNLDGASLLKVLEEKRNLVRLERLRLARRELMIDGLTASLREALSCRYDVLSVERQDEERLECVPSHADALASLADSVWPWVEYLDFYARSGRVPQPPFGLILDAATLSQGRYGERFYFSKATKSTPKSLLQIKKKGRYALWAHQGDQTSHLSCLKAMYKQIRARGFELASDCYCYDLATYALLGSGERYAAKYAVELRAEAGEEREALEVRN